MTGLVFDLDGTLVDSVPAIRDIANTLMAELDLAPLDLDETRGYIGNGAGAFVERALNMRDANDPSLLADRLNRFEEIYAAAPGDANRAMPGVDDALLQLTAQGCSFAVCTNKPMLPTMAVIDALGWRNLISIVVAGDTLDVRKPDPEPLFEAARQLATTATIYIGDSEVDATTAEAANIPFLLYTEGYRKTPVDQLPHADSFSDFSELPAVVAAFDGSSNSAGCSKEGEQAAERLS